jgi:hypothetical protein
MWRLSRRCLVSARHFSLITVEALTLGLLAAGCAPLSAPVPFHLAETATPLQRGEMRINGAVGGGILGLDGSGGGGDARLRIGVGGRQEVGVEGELIRVDTGTPNDKSPSWIGKSNAYGLKLSWKGAPTDWFAVIAGAGVMSSATGESAGGDLAIVFSRPVGIVRPYAGFRGTFALPVGRALKDAGGVTSGLIVPGGVAFHYAKNCDFFLEMAYVNLWSDLTSDSGSTSHGGFYGLAAMAFAFMP